MKHSAGPWRNIANCIVKAKDGTIVCDCRGTWHPSGDPKIEQATSAANARLIAAAPELLGALEVALATIYDLMTLTRNSPNAEDNAAIASFIKATIAKAKPRGEP